MNKDALRLVGSIIAEFLDIESAVYAKFPQLESDASATPGRGPLGEVR